MHCITRALVPRIGLQPFLTAALVFLASRSQAQPNSLTVELDFASEAPCPDRAAFIRWVEARVGRPIQEGSGGFAFQVVVSRAGEEFRGHLRARSGQEVTERDLTGQNCQDVVSGLALVAALALDPNASTAPQTEPTEPNTPLPEQARKPSPEPPKPPIPAAAPAPSVPFVRPAPVPETPLSYAISVLGAVSVDTGPAPVALIGLGPKAVAEFYSSSLWQPAFGLGVAFAQTGFIGAEEPKADFGWWAVRLSVCPLGSEITRGGRLRACVLGDIGSTSAEGREDAIAVTERTNEFWAATGLGATFSYHPIPPLFIELGGGALVAWTRPVYYFADPRTDVHEVPVPAFNAHLGLGLSFSDQ
jgi:hypothetical protein